MEELYKEILHYGEFIFDRERVDDFGNPIRVRIAKYNGKKYLIIQKSGYVSEIKKID